VPDQRVGEVDDPLLVGVRDDQRPVERPPGGVIQDLLEHDHLAGPLEAERVDDVERVVEQDLLALAQVGHVDRGRDCHAQLAAAGEHVHRAVLVRSRKTPYQLGGCARRSTSPSA
jgi:hypothetical protein